MTDAFILAIDVGSQSVRASLFDRDGHMAALACVSAPVPAEPSSDYAETDAEAFFHAVQSACQQLRDTAGAAYSAISGLTLTTQRATTVFLGHDGRPLRPAILWSDQRRTPSPAPIGGLMGLAITVSGLARTVDALRERAPALWMARQEPENYAASHRIVLLSSYLMFRLSDRWIDSAASQVGYLPFNFRRRRWYKPRNWRWRALGLRPDHQLVDLAAPGTHVGELSSTSANALGLPTGTPLLAAAADKACEVLGSGCVGHGATCLSFGTAATVNLVHDHYATVQWFLPAFPAADGEHYLSEIQVAMGFWRVSWFLREFGVDLLERARVEKQPPETYLDACLIETEPVAGELASDPFFTNGGHAPGAQMRDALTGLIQRHTRACVYRALMESLLLDLRRALARLERRRSMSAQHVVIAGGGAQSDLIMQLAANVLGRPALRASAGEATSLGAAMCAAVGLGWQPDFRTAVQRMTKSALPVDPQPHAQALYARLYRDHY